MYGRERLVVDVADDAFEQLDLDRPVTIERRREPDFERAVAFDVTAVNGGRGRARPAGGGPA